PGSTVTIVTTNATSAVAALGGAEGTDAPTDAGQAGIPTTFALTAIRPNPFSGSTEVRYALPTPARVQVTLYSITGQRMREIVNEDQSTGYQSARVDGRGLVPGIYLVRMRATALDGSGRRFTEVRKVVMN